MKQNLSESSLCVSYCENLKGKNMFWTPESVGIVASSMITSIADYLAMVKKKDEVVALEIQDHAGNFKMAGIVSYCKNESEDDETPGEWELTFTFNEEDLVDIKSRYTIHDSFFQNVAAASSYKETLLQFSQITYMVDMFSAMAEELYKWLDVNASETEVVELDHDGYFLGRVSFEDGHKVFSLVPSEEIKQKVKHDADKSVAA